MSTNAHDAEPIPANVLAIFASILKVSEAQDRYDKSLRTLIEAQHEQIEQLYRELAELRDEHLGLSNRIESTVRVLTSRTEHLA